MDPDESNSGTEGESPAPPKRHWFRTLLRCLVLTLAIAIAALAYAYHLSQKEPEFYQVALRQTPEFAKAKGAELETTVMEVYNAVLEQGPWRGEISQDQINGWLATELPQKFPEMLPEDVVGDPRVSIVKGEIRLAGRAQYQGVKGIVVALSLIHI